MNTYTVSQVLIRWKLRQIMADRRMTTKRLSEILGVTPTSVSRMKGDRMPRLTDEGLTNLCNALSCTPHDLIEWVLEEERTEA
ncbi:MAG TPA: helix-turn-helix transcriptional regulator [Candidatus Obscuribacterales bacterium]